LFIKRRPAILRVVDSFIQSKTFTLILFAVALVLGTISVFGRIESVGLAGLVAGTGTVVYF
jgi:hypothetical protein